MKKLLILFFLACSLSLAAQHSSKNSLSVIAGPNWFVQFSKQSDIRFVPKTGFSAGLDYTRSITARLQLRAFGRYNIWRSLAKQNNLRWPSEFGPDGTWTPDPNLPHSVETDVTDKSWQLLAGLRYLGKPGLFSWYADAESGVTDYIEEQGGKAPLRFTIGLGTGVEWQPPARHFGVFVQPGARYIFPLGLESAVDFNFLILSLESGVRWHF